MLFKEPAGEIPFSFGLEDESWFKGALIEFAEPPYEVVIDVLGVY